MPRVLALALLLLPLLSPDVSTAREAEPSPMAANAMPPPPAWLGALDTLYDKQVRVTELEDRAFSPEHWWDVAGPLATPARGFHTEDVGRSAEGRPLRHVSWGEGDTRVLLWSQMHGDESTASMALADLFRFLGEHPQHPLVQRLRKNTALHFLPVMNPDGAARFQRRNAQGIDVNRDARALVTSEARALHDLRERVKPAFGFNLHDQNVGYRAGDSDRGTAIALLAPAFNEARDVDASRTRAIEVAVAIRAVLEPYIAGHIAKWDDTFNPRAFGDLTAQAGVSTVLIESGGIEGDLQKQRLRKLNFLALIGALDAIATGAHAGLPRARYEELPENGKVWPDLRISGGTLALPGQPQAKVDLLVEFERPLLERGGVIADIGDLGDVRARRSIDASGLYIVPFDPPGTPAGNRKTFAPDLPAYFHLSRDPQGHDVVWTLAGDVDPAKPTPP
ncbi:zinc carboxypeptidase [Luteimonas cucumeris]|uniref:Zinc carboxypeptidase n=1 Tax=Luteimonas cucumeris TaxID=985012 RepID=A0A562LAE4_9GAMM|nr:M14 family zinc carboxypeptidase [Luteimonas cucumeris]TWI04637.1 zinc carboxypeptidase [Luteimonas cucumeris]